MAKEPPSQRYGTSSGRFWVNVVLIALAHIVLIAGLIRWSVAAKASSNPESIVWLGGAGDLSADESENQESPPPKQPSTATESSRLEQDEAVDEKPVVTTAKSEIELPSATPKPTPTASPAKPSATPAPRPKVTPKPIAKPTPKETLVAKPSPKPAANPKPRLQRKRTRSRRKKTKLLSQKGIPRLRRKQAKRIEQAKLAAEAVLPNLAGMATCCMTVFTVPGSSPPRRSLRAPKISTLVNVRIEKDGRVSKFEIAKPSGNATVNESVAAVAKQISQVDPPPTGLIKGDHYDVKINFELNTEKEDSN